MINYSKLYNEKLNTAENVAKSLPKKCNISAAFYSGMPVKLMEAIAKAAREGCYDRLNFYYMHSTQHMGEHVLNIETAKILRPHPFYMGPAERKLVQACIAQGEEKLLEYMPGNFSAVPKIMADVIGIDVFVLRVSTMDKHGYFSIGLTGAYTQQVMRKCKKIIVEVNQHMPRSFGDTLIHISDIESIVEDDQIIEALPFRDATPIDYEIGKYIVSHIDDRSCVQFGIGGVPNVIAEMIKNRKDLGVHSELLADGLMELIQSGAVTNRYKRTNPYKSVFNVAMGSKELYQYINDNPSIECYGADYVNDPYVISQNDKVVSVNSFIEIDLTGQVNAEFLNHHQYSAPGGQLDFVRAAVMSNGGKSFLAAPSTAAYGKVSRIVAKLNSVTTDSRSEPQYIVTEYGIANLRGKSNKQRALSLIELAAPEFRAKLLEDAKKYGLL
ncbi:acetyl-CoA hydrolase/transferase family protein [Cysteiniphilum halobium]|uniref:acetyl-CoA hydrolase/transferase family protein n=1 Tax=Cysteiniphilum halobium TaxID=2219059 RepID=UPI003F852A72